MKHVDMGADRTEQLGQLEELAEAFKKSGKRDELAEMVEAASHLYGPFYMRREGSNLRRLCRIVDGVNVEAERCCADADEDLLDKYLDLLDKIVDKDDALAAKQARVRATAAEAEFGPERAASTQGELDEITAELVEDLRQKRTGWADIYTRIERVEQGELWRAAGYSSLTKWIEELARRAGCQVQYIWRVKKAGKFYQAYAAAEAAAGREVKPIEECGLGDEMLADLDRVSDGDQAKAAKYMGMALNGTLTKGKVKDMARTAAAARRAAKAVGAHANAASDAEAAEQASAAAATAADVLLSLDAPALFYTEEERGARLAPWQRRSFKLLSEFPVNTGTSDRARRMDALVIGSRGAVDQYEVTLDMVEIKVTEYDLTHDTKHLEYEPFADRCWFAVPADLVHRALELAPEGWGVIKYDSESGAASIEQGAELRPGLMRCQTLATACLRLMPPMR